MECERKKYKEMMVADASFCDCEKVVNKHRVSGWDSKELNVAEAFLSAKVCQGVFKDSGRVNEVGAARRRGKNEELNEHNLVKGVF